MYILMICSRYLVSDRCLVVSLYYNRSMFLAYRLTNKTQPAVPQIVQFETIFYCLVSKNGIIRAAHLSCQYDGIMNSYEKYFFSM